jgi:hypothetical protein
MSSVVVQTVRSVFGTRERYHGTRFELMCKRLIVFALDDMSAEDINRLVSNTFDLMCWGILLDWYWQQSGPYFYLLDQGKDLFLLAVNSLYLQAKGGNTFKLIPSGVLTEHSQLVTSMTVSNGRVWTASADQSICIWGNVRSFYLL